MRFPNLGTFIGIVDVHFHSVIPMRRISHFISFSSSERHHFERASIISFTDTRGLNFTEMEIMIYEYACIRNMFFDIVFKLEFSHYLTQKPVNVTNYYVWQQAEKRISTCPVAGECFNTVMTAETPMAFL